MPDLALENARNVSINLKGEHGKFVMFQLYFAAKWILVSELTFYSGELEMRRIFEAKQFVTPYFFFTFFFRQWTCLHLKLGSIAISVFCLKVSNASVSRGNIKILLKMEMGKNLRERTSFDRKFFDRCKLRFYILAVLISSLRRRDDRSPSAGSSSI